MSSCSCRRNPAGSGSPGTHLTSAGDGETILSRGRRASSIVSGEGHPVSHLAPHALVGTSQGITCPRGGLYGGGSDLRRRSPRGSQHVEPTSCVVGAIMPDKRPVEPRARRDGRAPGSSLDCPGRAGVSRARRHPAAAAGPIESLEARNKAPALALHLRIDLARAVAAEPELAHDLPCEIANLLREIERLIGPPRRAAGTLRCRRAAAPIVTARTFPRRASPCGLRSTRFHRRPARCAAGRRVPRACPGWSSTAPLRARSRASTAPARR